ncbi:uncharacterized protein LOC111867932 isoform X3 [Cryptotermes secundus]|uniref:uncharacterized protein LOC111867932 isoform X3 n=1 Tax=Cryptotermes secundus TaxID=105785 RepID=UPI000CD7B44A|nr:uncharacterized protein LOC111867932 isoform X3 [Cryptotermes secundus]
MTTITVLLLLVAAASTIAFSPPERNGGPALEVRRFAVDETAHPWFVVRRRRGIPAASKSASGAASFATSSSSSGSTSGSGSVPGYHSGFDGVQGHSGGNPSGFVFPGANDFANYGYGAYSPYGGAGYVPVDFNTLFQQYLNFMQRLAQQQAYATNEINSRAAFPGPNDFSGSPGFVFPEATHFGGSVSDGGPVSASASASLGPKGGFGSVSISPPPQGNLELGTRMGSVPPSDGNNFSVFTSSSSSSSDENGVRKSSKEATSVINDNGKITTYHVSDP